MIKIANRCDANWQEMQPQPEGKFCSSCEKVVVDFSKMSDTQIKEYFIKYQDQKTCGRFLQSQVDRELKTSKNTSRNNLWSRLNHIPLLRSVALLCASSFLWLSSCVRKQTTLGEPSVEDPSCNTQLMGDTVVMPVPEDTTSFIPQENSLEVKGEIAPEQEMITGKIRMVDTISQQIKKKK